MQRSKYMASHMPVQKNKKHQLYHYNHTNLGNNWTMQWVSRLQSCHWNTFPTSFENTQAWQCLPYLNVRKFTTFLKHCISKYIRQGKMRFSDRGKNIQQERLLTGAAINSACLRSTLRRYSALVWRCLAWGFFPSASGKICQQTQTSLNIASVKLWLKKLGSLH